MVFDLYESISSFWGMSIAKAVRLPRDVFDLSTAMHQLHKERQNVTAAYLLLERKAETRVNSVRLHASATPGPALLLANQRTLAPPAPPHHLTVSILPFPFPFPFPFHPVRLINTHPLATSSHTHLSAVAFAFVVAPAVRPRI
jgi:hypothetical protein